jgi:hypothetical protein
MERALPSIRSSYMAQERKMWTKMFVMFVTLLVAIIMGILSIYWGADHSLQFNLPVFTVAIIDFDGGGWAVPTADGSCSSDSKSE